MGGVIGIVRPGRRQKANEALRLPCRPPGHDSVAHPAQVRGDGDDETAAVVRLPPLRDQRFARPRSKQEPFERGKALGGDARLPERARRQRGAVPRSEEHTSELQSLMRISYAVFCLKNKQHNSNDTTYTTKTI